MRRVEDHDLAGLSRVAARAVAIAVDRLPAALVGGCDREGRARRRGRAQAGRPARRGRGSCGRRRRAAPAARPTAALGSSSSRMRVALLLSTAGSTASTTSCPARGRSPPSRRRPPRRRRQHRVAAAQQPAGDGVEDLVEHRVADARVPAPRSGQRERLAGDRQVPGAVDVKRRVVHGRDVRGELVGVVARARAVRAATRTSRSDALVPQSRVLRRSGGLAVDGGPRLGWLGRARRRLGAPRWRAAAAA